MSKVCTFKCEDVVFDVYNTERISMNSKKVKYYITPKRFAKIEVWRVMNDITTPISTKEQLTFLIENDYIGTYK
jgi:hypothetical protein